MAHCSVSEWVLRHYRPLYERLKGPFLLPPGFPGHAHAWVQLDVGYCVCSMCGVEHVCFRGECPVVETDASERACTVTGCVVTSCEMRAEWGAADRVVYAAPPQHHHHQPRPPPGCSRAGGLDLPEFVEVVVREILDSPKTRACRADEALRDHHRRLSALGRLLRPASTGCDDGADDDADDVLRPRRRNMVEVEAQLAWACRKCRAPPPNRGAAVTQRVISVCADGICSLLRVHGWQRVARQLQHATRGREFVCSMLYLMRVGITYHDRCLLQRVDALHALLPLQVFLPTVFGIRAKSITEGENIIKLDIRRMPM